MFKQSQTASPVAPTVGGIGGMTTPDQNAQALKNMFAPTVPAARPTQSFPTPQAGYKRGGEVINGVAHFVGGGEAAAPAPTQDIPDRISQELLAGRQAPTASAPTTSNVPVQRGIETSEAGQMAMAKISAGRTGRNPRLVQEGFADLQRITDEAYAKANIPAASPEESFRRVSSGLDVITPEKRGRMEDKDRLDQTVPGGMFSRSVAPAPAASAPPAPAPVVPPPDPFKESIQTNLQAIKERREASDKQREENKNLALLSAGLGMMAGTSRNAFANIGAGGQQGIATFAGLEKARREDDASRRQESYQQQQLSLQTQQLAQQKEIAFAQLSQDPETVRTYAVLGGATASSTPEERRAAIRKGFDFMQSKDALKQAGDLLKLAATDPNLLTPEQRTILGNLVFGNVTTGVGERSGSGSPPGWGGRLVSPAPTR
jgi:hypothetical protein